MHTRRHNEIDFWSPVPRVSLAGDLDGLPVASPGRNLQVKPNALGKSGRPTGVGTSFDPSANAWLDVKSGVTRRFRSCRSGCQV